MGSFWAYVFDVFLKCFFDGLGLHLGSQNTSKMRPNKGPNQNLKIIDCVSIYNTLATFRGAEQCIFLLFFLKPYFGRALGSNFNDFGSLLGSLLDPILVTFLAPILRQFLDPLNTSKKWGYPPPILSQQYTLPPPPRTPPS